MKEKAVAEHIRSWLLEFREDITKHSTDLPDTPDHVLIILKGHLLVEQEINRLLETKLPNPGALKLRDTHGPKFAHKLSLLRALIPSLDHVPDFWGICKKLNDLRNDFAHDLNPAAMEAKVEEFAYDVNKAFAESEHAERAFRVVVALKLGQGEKLSQREKITISLCLIVWYLGYLTTKVMIVKPT